MYDLKEPGSQGSFSCYFEFTSVKPVENSCKISVDNVVFVVYNGIINNKRKVQMKESEKLRKENDELQAKIEQQLRDINKLIEDINSK